MKINVSLMTFIDSVLHSEGVFHHYEMRNSKNCGITWNLQIDVSCTMKIIFPLHPNEINVAAIRSLLKM